MKSVMEVYRIILCREGFRAKSKELIGDNFQKLSDMDKTSSVMFSGMSSGRRIRRCAYAYID